MKKVLAIVLSALLICVSMAPMSFAATKVGFVASVNEGKYKEGAVQVTEVTKDTFTLVIKAPKVTKLYGANFYFTFDDAAVKVVEAGPAGHVDSDSNFVDNFQGMWTHGLKKDFNNEYGFGFVSEGGQSKSTAKEFVYITFQILDITKKSTDVELHINEFFTEDGNDKNEISSSILESVTTIKFNFDPDVTAGKTTVPGTTQPTATDLNGLIDIIKGIISGNGATIDDFTDAIANIAGNADLGDMIERLIGGDLDIGDGFKDLLKGFDLDFGSFEDILNKIIDFFKGLFNGDTNKKTTTVITTGAESNTESTTSTSDTTSNGSSSGSEKAGDAGIALAATVCVAAAAAFVLTRKKKETV